MLAVIEHQEDPDERRYGKNCWIISSFNTSRLTFFKGIKGFVNLGTNSLFKTNLLSPLCIMRESERTANH